MFCLIQKTKSYLIEMAGRDDVCWGQIVEITAREKAPPNINHI